MSLAQVKLSFIGGGVEVYDREWITLEFCGQGDRLTLRCPEGERADVRWADVKELAVTGDVTLHGGEALHAQRPE